MSTGFWVAFPHTHAVCADHVLPHSCARLPQLPPLESFPAHTDHWSPPRLVFLASAYKGENVAFVFLFCPRFTEQNVLLFHRLWHKGQDFIFFSLWPTYSSVHKYRILSSFICCWDESCLSVCEWYHNKHGYAGTSFSGWVRLRWLLPRSGIAELYNGSIFSNPHAIPHISSWMD